MKYIRCPEVVSKGKIFWIPKEWIWNLEELTKLFLPRCLVGFSAGAEVKNPPGKAGDSGSIPELRRCPWVENGNPL